MDEILSLIIIAAILYVAFQAYYYMRDKKRYGIELSSYPIFSQQDLMSLNRNIQKEHEKLIKNWDKLKDRFEIESKGSKAFYNKNFSNQLKGDMRSYIFDEVLNFYYKFELNLRIESNIAVQNGNQIDKVKKDYSDKSSKASDIEAKTEKVYLEWLNSRKGSYEWTEEYDKLFK